MRISDWSSDVCSSDLRPVGGGRTADAGGGRAGISRGYPPQIPLSGPAARAAAPQYRASLQRHRIAAAADDRQGLHRVPDADPDRLLARRRARLSGAQPRASRQVLRAAAGPTDVQAAADGGSAEERRVGEE